MANQYTRYPTVSGGGGGGGGGTVTQVSVATANGFAGSVTNPTTIPSISITTTVTGILFGNGTSVAAAVAGNFPTLNQNTTGTAANITASSNSTLTTLSALSLPYSQITGAPAALTFADSIVNTSGTVTLVNDASSPGATMYYGTNSGGTKGFYSIPATGVTSVALADSTGLFNITGSPVTSTGTLTLASFQSQAQHTFFAAPSGSSGAPTFRTIVASDIPTLNQNTTGTAANITASSNSTLTTLSALSLPTSQLTGTLQAAQEPAHTGDVTNTAGSLALSIVATTNSTLTTLSALSLPYSQLTGAPTALVFADSIVNTSGTVTLVNDSASPGVSKYYGTNGSSTLGYFSLPSSSNPMTTLGDMIYGGASGVETRLAGNSTGNSRQILFSIASGGVATAPQWTTLISGDIPNNAANTTGTAANITASSNSTLTTLSALSLPYSQLTGAPAALVFADSIVNTSGTVTLVNDSASPGASMYYGTNASSVLGYYSVSGGGGVTSVTGTAPIASSGGSTPAISLNTNGVTNTYLAQMPADTIKGNNTGGTANAADLTESQVATMLSGYIAAWTALGFG